VNGTTGWCGTWWTGGRFVGWDDGVRRVTTDADGRISTVSIVPFFEDGRRDGAGRCTVFRASLKVATPSADLEERRDLAILPDPVLSTSVAGLAGLS
jgi:hypothetical protein